MLGEFCTGEPSSCHEPIASIGTVSVRICSLKSVDCSSKVYSRLGTRKPLESASNVHARETAVSLTAKAIQLRAVGCVELGSPIRRRNSSGGGTGARGTRSGGGDTDFTRCRRCSSVAGASGSVGERIGEFSRACASTALRTCFGRRSASRAAKYPPAEVPTTVTPFILGWSSRASSSRSIWLSHGRAA